ncbi:MAG TPA: hypothetical protein VHA78_05075 [Candidatus Peribacteraceae bacterium]|nr:hypothetical protein [Candidatus Peribacteraceae bacterium]
MTHVSVSTIRGIGSLAVVFSLFAAPIASAASSSSSSSSSSVQDGVTVGVTDGQDHVAPGAYLTYAVTVQQSVSPSKTVDVSLTLPSYVNTATPSDSGKQVGNLILWDNVGLTQNTAKVLTVSINLQPNIPQNTQLVAKAQAGNDQATDTTIVQSGTTGSHPFLISITDNKTSANPGDQLTYIVAVKNMNTFTEHADVKVSLSGQVAIDDTNPPSTVSYPSITWSNVSFAGNEQKLFTIDATINKRVTAYTSITAQANVDGTTANDTTTVVPYGTAASSSSRSSVRSASSASSSSVNPSRSVLFRKVADSSEVVPGGTIKYTLYVQNILLNVIHNAVITDRFDPSLMSVADAGNGSAAAGQLQWTLPTLQPGQVWKTTYSMKVNPGIANGTAINNVATLNGTDVATATLNEKVTVATANVVGTLPTTGAAYDLLALILIAPAALGMALLQRKVRG